ncbi:protein diaphanous homolog 1-like [Uranotaenia lowii]|uniref:protein diaphanous homolog 1-like n=1 Tax=Uranotaenia lowii TaxID=190385 RepID=UPI00247A9164|nr:protein diaphanous homolog 1-like [Uranotaenia lowii]
MKLKSVCFFLTFLVAASAQQLVCYTCEDCNNQIPLLQPCGGSFPALEPIVGQSPVMSMDDPLLTPPPLPGGGNSGGNPINPGDPILTPPPVVGGGSGGTNVGNGGGNPWDPILTPPPLPGNGGVTSNPWDPIITPAPGQIGGDNVNQGLPGNPVLTPPTFPPAMNNNNNGGLPGIFTPPPLIPAWPAQKAMKAQTIGRQFGCVVVRTQVNNREVVRRGCAVLESTQAESCQRVTGGRYLQCTVCSTSLCNGQF